MMKNVCRVDYLLLVLSMLAHGCCMLHTRYGARGGITGGGGNVTPGLMSKLHAAVDGGDYTGAMVFQREFNAIQEALSVAITSNLPHHPPPCLRY